MNKSKIEQALKQFEVVGQIMGGVRDQASYDAARQQIAQIIGPEAAANQPAAYDPAIIEQSRAKAMGVKDQLEQKWKELDYRLNTDKFAYQQKNDVQNRAVQIRGQNLTDARAREQIAAASLSQPFQVTDPSGKQILVQQDKRTGQLHPVQGGYSPKASDKALTEDQGKATAWLSQAENAFSNMQKATSKDPSAAKPGFPDAVAAIPSLGLTGAIANTMRSDNRQKFMQAASSLSEALLRAATGAGVNKDEASQKIRELTPVFGDSDSTIKQKMDAIPIYIESLKVRAGPGAKFAPSASQSTLPSGWTVQEH